MSEKKFLAIGSSFGFLAVALGAFGAHALKTKISPEMLAIFETGARYQLFHALAILFVFAAAPLIRHACLPFAGWCFSLGTVIFSGSLYALVFSGQKFWGAVTPLGGLLLLAGWGLLFLSGISKK